MGFRTLLAGNPTEGELIRATVRATSDDEGVGKPFILTTDNLDIKCQVLCCNKSRAFCEGGLAIVSERMYSHHYIPTPYRNLSRNLTY